MGEPYDIGIQTVALNSCAECQVDKKQTASSVCQTDISAEASLLWGDGWSNLTSAGIEAIQEMLGAVLYMLEEALLENEAFDCFSGEVLHIQYKSEADSITSKETGAIQLKEKYADVMRCEGSHISCLDWIGGENELFAVSGTKSNSSDIQQKSFQENDTSNYIMLWSAHESLSPVGCFMAPSAIKTFKFASFAAGMLFAGSSDGLLIGWEVPLHLKNQRSSSSRESHFALLESGDTFEYPIISHKTCLNLHGTTKDKEPVVDLLWVPKIIPYTEEEILVRNFITGNDSSTKKSSNESIEALFQNEGCNAKLGLLLCCFESSKIIICSVSKKQTQNFASHSDSGTVSRSNAEGCVPIVEIVYQLNLPAVMLALPGASLVPEEWGLPPKITEGSQQYAAISAIKVLRFFSSTDDDDPEMLICTDEGALIKCKCTSKGDNVSAQIVLKQEDKMRNSLVAVLLSPFEEDVVLVVSYWEISIWKLKLQISLASIVSLEFSNLCTGACWSRVKSGAFYIGRRNGSVELWNLLYSMKEPFCRIQVSSTSIIHLCAQPFSADKNEVREDIVEPVVQSSTESYKDPTIDPSEGSRSSKELYEILIAADTRASVFVFKCVHTVSSKSANKKSERQNAVNLLLMGAEKRVLFKQFNNERQVSVFHQLSLEEPGAYENTLESRSALGTTMDSKVKIGREFTAQELNQCEQSYQKFYKKAMKHIVLDQTKRSGIGNRSSDRVLFKRAA